MFIDPGAYEIQSVTHRTFATQVESKVVATASNRLPSVPVASGQMNLWRTWSISRLDNDKYTIRNIESNHYAASPNFPAIEMNIITTQNLHQWDIKETGFKGRYVIYTTAADIDLFWGLTNDQLRTPISLRDTPNTPSNQWELVKVNLWGVVGELRARLSEHVNCLEKYTKLQNEHIQLVKDMKLRDELREASSSAGVLDINVALDTIQQERARHLQAEADLRAIYEKLLAERDQNRRCICM